MPLYRVPPAAVQSTAAGQASAFVACRCCPGGESRSSRRRYPSDMDDREWAICEPLLPEAPTAAVIDSQSVRAAEEVARSSRGYDAGNKCALRGQTITVGLLAGRAFKLSVDFVR